MPQYDLFTNQDIDTFRNKNIGFVRNFDYFEMLKVYVAFFFRFRNSSVNRVYCCFT